MQRFADPSSLGFFALGVAFLVRIPNAIRVRTARLTWLASGVGALALLYCGTLIPILVLDGLLGGTNYLSLLQNVSATLAFWLVMKAVITQGRFPLRQLFRWPLHVGIVAFVIPFFFIDHGATSQDFMFERADQLPTFLYSSIYLAMIAGICAYLSAKVWKGGYRTFAVLLTGAQFVILGSLFQILGLGGICFSWFSEPVNVALYRIGVTSMSGGVVCMAANMAGIALMRVRSSRQVFRTIKSVEDIMREKGVPLPEHLTSSRLATTTDAALNQLHKDVIAVSDHIHTDETSLSNAEREKVEAASRLVSQKMFAEDPRPRRYPRLNKMILRWAVRGSRPSQ